MTKQQSMWVEVCEAESLGDNLGVCAKIGGAQIAIFKVSSAGSVFYYGIDNVDPFSEAAVLSRGLIGEKDGKFYIASPIYKQRFLLETGQCLDAPEVSLKVYSVRNNQGKIELAL